MLRYLAPRCTPGVEVVTGSTYARTFRSGWVSVRALEVVASPSLKADVLPRLARLFDIDTDLAPINEALSADPLLSPLIRQRPGLHVAGAVDRFELALRAVLGQQVSVAAASTFSGRLAAMLGDPIRDAPSGLTRLNVTAEQIAECRPSKIQTIGLTVARATTVVALARACVAGLLADDNDPERQLAELRAIKGIGDWTASYIAMRALHDPDAFPHGDLGLRKAAGNLTARQLLSIAERWRPYRAYAAMHLWASLHA